MGVIEDGTVEPAPPSPLREAMLKLLAAGYEMVRPMKVDVEDLEAAAKGEILSPPGISAKPPRAAPLKKRGPVALPAIPPPPAADTAQSPVA